MNNKHLATGLLSFAILVLLSTFLPGSMSTAWAAAGTGPDQALALPSDWQSLESGERLWYAFYYDGSDAPIHVRLQTAPEEGADFEVWTPDNVHRWRDGAEVEPIGRGSPDPRANDTLVWSGSFVIPGTYYLVVEHSEVKPNATYYLLEISGDGVSLSAPTSVPKTTPQPTAQAKAAVAPAGRLAFQTTWGGPFYTINVNGSNLQRITDGIDATWSRDGQQIAFTRWREPRGVYVIDVDVTGGAPGDERRVFDWTQTRWPSWSPDDAQILFSRATGRGRQDAVEYCFFGFCFSFPAHPHWRLATIRPADGDFREPPSSEISHAPMWSPDGTRVVYDDVQGLRVQNMDKSLYHMITHDPSDTGPVWSPDGQRVAFVRRQHDHWEIYVVDADGRNPGPLTRTPPKPDGEVGNSAAPAWSPDGSHIAFLTDRTGRWEIWVMRADGSQQRPMFTDELDGLHLEYGSVSERGISWTE